MRRISKKGEKNEDKVCILQKIGKEGEREKRTNNLIHRTTNRHRHKRR